LILINYKLLLRVQYKKIHRLKEETETETLLFSANNFVKADWFFGVVEIGSNPPPPSLSSRFLLVCGQ
jgi:hypothetical protein